MIRKEIQEWVDAMKEFPREYCEITDYDNDRIIIKNHRTGNMLSRYFKYDTIMGVAIVDNHRLGAKKTADMIVKSLRKQGFYDAVRGYNGDYGNDYYYVSVGDKYIKEK